MSWADGKRNDQFRRTEFKEPVDVWHPLGKTTSTRELPETRIVIIAKQDDLLPYLLQTPCKFRLVGSDWHIECRGRAETDRLLTFLKVHGVHGILKHRKRRRK